MNMGAGASHGRPYGWSCTASLRRNYKTRLSNVTEAKCRQQQGYRVVSPASCASYI
jgi:hypothetical protein